MTMPRRLIRRPSLLIRVCLSSHWYINVRAASAPDICMNGVVSESNDLMSSDRTADKRADIAACDLREPILTVSFLDSPLVMGTQCTSFAKSKQDGVASS
jgi:hypothetical protein